MIIDLLEEDTNLKIKLDEQLFMLISSSIPRMNHIAEYEIATTTKIENNFFSLQ